MTTSDKMLHNVSIDNTVKEVYKNLNLENKIKLSVYLNTLLEKVPPKTSKHFIIRALDKVVLNGIDAEKVKKLMGLTNSEVKFVNNTKAQIEEWMKENCINSEPVAPSEGSPEGSNEVL